jgi:hypothetical protein
MDEAKAVLAEARRLKPDLSIKWLLKHKPVLQFAFDGVRKAGCRRNERDPASLSRPWSLTSSDTAGLACADEDRTLARSGRCEAI